jgi:hypothetical protein
MRTLNGKSQTPTITFNQEGVMDKVWLYVGSIIAGAAVLTYFVITTISNTSPPASDLRAAYEATK